MLDFLYVPVFAAAASSCAESAVVCPLQHCWFAPPHLLQWDQWDHPDHADLP